MAKFPLPEPEEHDGIKELCANIRRILGTLADETVLSEELLADKRFLEEFLAQLELTMFGVEFWVDEMADSMKSGWQRVLELSKGSETFANLGPIAQDMLDEIARYESEPPFTLKDELTVPELRKMLRAVRTAISQASSSLAMMELVKGMQGWTPDIRQEQQENIIRAGRDEILPFEAVICAELEKRGEKVPRWRNRPKEENA